MFKYFIIILTGILMTNHTQAQEFPTIQAETLSQKKVVFPDIAEGRYAFILIAFKRQTQGEVDSWLDTFIEEFGGEEDITFYEIPMISGNWKWMSSWIDSGMRAGVPDYKHDHVATYYGPLSRYFEYFDIKDSRTVYVFFLDKQGNIIWRKTGPASEKRFEELRKVVQNRD